MKDATEDARERGDEAVSQPRARRLSPGALYFGMAAILVAKTLLARWLVLDPGSVFPGLLLEGVFILAGLGLVELLFYRWRRAAYLAVDVVVSLFLLTLTIYASYYDQIISPSALGLVGQVPSVGSSIIALLRPVYLLYLLDVPVLLVALRPRSQLQAGDPFPPSRRVLTAAGFSLAICGMLSISAAIALPNTDSAEVARTRGILAYESATAAQAIVGEGSTPFISPVAAAHADEVLRAGTLDFSRPASVQTAIDNIADRAQGERIAEFKSGRFVGVNVIAVQVESLQDFVIDDWVTPNIDRLRQESWYFPNTFSQAGLGTTSDAEFVMNTSLYPPDRNPASVEYSDRVLPALPRLLREVGYNTFTMHANTAKYWNRKELYPALGFSSYYDDEFFGRDHIIGMGASDRTLFRMALPVVVEQAAKGPIYCQLVTLSPHHPFRMPAGTIKIDMPPWLSGSTVGNYLEAMNYEDRQIGWFIGQLKKSGLWDKSIFVLYGDHAGLRSGDLKDGFNMVRLETILGHQYTPVDRSNIPLLIHVPEQTQGVWCESPVGQVDIMPTIADALGLDLSAVPHMGRSAFDSSDPLLARCNGLPKGSLVSGSSVYVPGHEAVPIISADSAARSDSGQVPSRAAVNRLLEISDAWVRSLPERSASGGTKGAIIPRKLKTSPSTSR